MDFTLARRDVVRSLTYLSKIKGKAVSKVVSRTHGIINSSFKDLDLQILPPERRMPTSELSKRLSEDCEQRHLLVDVRNEAEFNMCRIDGSVNYPIEALYGGCFEKLLEEIRDGSMVTFVCRRGNDSQVVAEKVLEAIEEQHRGKVNDLRGGLHAWSNEVDNNFPIY